jgi:hypothetical protein
LLDTASKIAASSDLIEEPCLHVRLADLMMALMVPFLVSLSVGARARTGRDREGQGGAGEGGTGRKRILRRAPVTHGCALRHVPEYCAVILWMGACVTGRLA